MKKTYSAPLMEIEKFDVADGILAASGAPATSGEITRATGNNSTGAAYEVIVDTQW